MPWTSSCFSTRIRTDASTTRSSCGKCSRRSSSRPEKESLNQNRLLLCANLVDLSGNQERRGVRTSLKGNDNQEYTPHPGLRHFPFQPSAGLLKFMKPKGPCSVFVFSVPGGRLPVASKPWLKGPLVNYKWGFTDIGLSNLCNLDLTSPFFLSRAPFAGANAVLNPN